MAKKINLSIFKKFFQSGKVGGIILLVCVIISLLIANSSQKDNFSELLAQNVGFNIGNLSLKYSVGAWINDGLMAIFFYWWD